MHRMAFLGIILAFCFTFNRHSVFRIQLETGIQFDSRRTGVSSNMNINFGFVCMFEHIIRVLSSIWFQSSVIFGVFICYSPKRKDCSVFVLFRHLTRSFCVSLSFRMISSCEHYFVSLFTFDFVTNYESFEGNNHIKLRTFILLFFFLFFE